jgi:hypothetical protein
MFSHPCRLQTFPGNFNVVISGATSDPEICWEISAKNMIKGNMQRSTMAIISASGTLMALSALLMLPCSATAAFKTTQKRCGYDDLDLEETSSSWIWSVPADCTHLMLQYQHFGDVGAVSLAEVLRTNTMLQFINVQGNDIGDPGMGAICDAVRENAKTVVQTINFSDNNIRDVGAMKLSALLEENTSIEEVWIRNNHISDMGGSAIYSAMIDNSHVVVFDLFGNNDLSNHMASEIIAKTDENIAAKKARKEEL